MIKPEVGDVILSFNTDNLFSKVIARVTDSKWSHVMLYIGMGNVLESTRGGVQVSPLKKYLDEKHNLLVLRLKAPPEVRKEVVRRAMKNVGKRYGRLQLLWYLFLRLIRQSENPRFQKDIQPNAMVCSEAVAKAMHELGYRIKPDFKAAGVEPADFVQSNLFEVVESYYPKRP